MAKPKTMDFTVELEKMKQMLSQENYDSIYDTTINRLYSDINNQILTTKDKQGKVDNIIYALEYVKVLVSKIIKIIHDILKIQLLNVFNGKGTLPAHRRNNYKALETDAQKWEYIRILLDTYSTTINIMISRECEYAYKSEEYEEIYTKLIDEYDSLTNSIHERLHYDEIYKKITEEKPDDIYERVHEEHMSGSLGGPYMILHKKTHPLSPVSSYATAPDDEPFYDASSELNIGGRKKNKTKKRTKRNKSTKRQRRNKRKSTKRT